MSRYELNLADTGDFSVSASDPTVRPPEAIAALCERFKAAFTYLQKNGAYDEKRRSFSQRLFQEAKVVLEGGEPAAPPAPSATPNLDHVEYAMSHQCVHGAVSMEKDILHFWKLPWIALTDEATAFWSRIDRMISKVRWLTPSDEKKRIYLDQLVSHAKFGLEQDDFKGASLALDQFANQFVAEEGPAIRQKYLTSTLGWAIGIAVVTLAIYGVGAFVKTETAYATFVPQKVCDVANTVLPLVAGACLGVVFFAFIRNLDMSFETIGNFDPARLKAGLRFALVAIITALACLLLGAGLIKIQIGEVALHEFATKQSAAMLLGVICGYADASITSMLTGVLDSVKKT